MPPRRRGSGRLAQNSHRPASRKKLAGVILRLPQKSGLRSHSHIPDGCYDHPVVILSARAASVTDDVSILIVRMVGFLEREEEVFVSNQYVYPIVQLTSFGETDIVDKIPSPKPRRAYLPIHPSPHPDTDVRLFLEQGVTLRKNSYINTRDKHTIPLDILVAYDRRDPNTRYVLKSESYKQLIDHAGFVPDPEASTSNTTPPVPPSSEVPLPIRPQPERLKSIPGSFPQTPPLNHSNWESQYGTVLDAREPLLVDIDNHNHYNTPRSSSHHTTPARPAVRHTAHNTRADTLPRYNNYNPQYHHGYNNTRNGGSSPGAGRRPRLAAILVLLVVAVVLALWWVWTSFGQLGQGLFSGLRWAGVNMWRLAKEAVAG